MGEDRNWIGAAWGLAAVAAAAAAGALAHRLRNRERRTLDEAARREAPGRFVRLADGWTHFEDRGPAASQPVVLIHGFSVPAYLWDATVPALLEAGFRVIRYDVYGRGYSDRPEARYDRALFERQLAGLLELLGVERPVDLVGLSMGGAIAAAYTAANADRVRRLVLIDPYAVRRRIGALSIPGLGEYLATVAYVPSLLRRQHADVRNTPWFSDWIDAYREQAEYRGFRRALLATARDFIARDPMPLFEAAAAAGKPMLLIWGERDNTMPVAASDRLREVLDDPEFLLVRGAGHVPHAQRPDIVNPAIVRFLRGRGEGTAPAA
jgi:pimeloyl-ACP methyl ester carboxylesterase